MTDITERSPEDIERSLTPTGALVMEVLAARLRLGQHPWPFGRRHGSTLTYLAERGYVGFKGGIVDHTYNVWLTDEGKAAWGLNKPDPSRNDDLRVDQLTSAIRLIESQAAEIARLARHFEDRSGGGVWKEGVGYVIAPAVDAPVPADPLVHRRRSLGSSRWAWCDSEIVDHLTGNQESVTCPECIEKVERFRARRDAQTWRDPAPAVPADPAGDELLTTDESIALVVRLLGGAINPWMVHLGDPDPDGHLEARLVVDPAIAIEALRIWAAAPAVPPAPGAPVPEDPQRSYAEVFPEKLAEVQAVYDEVIGNPDACPVASSGERCDLQRNHGGAIGGRPSHSGIINGTRRWWNDRGEVHDFSSAPVPAETTPEDER